MSINMDRTNKINTVFYYIGYFYSFVGKQDIDSREKRVTLSSTFYWVYKNLLAQY